jgi:hypothetical protein
MDAIWAHDHQTNHRRKQEGLSPPCFLRSQHSSPPKLTKLFALHLCPICRNVHHFSSGKFAAIFLIGREESDGQVKVSLNQVNVLHRGLDFLMPREL